MYTVPYLSLLAKLRDQNSQLELLKTYLRSTMTEERLSALAIIKVHRSMVEDLNYDKLVVVFANNHPHRMALPCVLIALVQVTRMLCR